MTAAGGARLTLLSRAYCHLCDDMAAALAPLAARFGAVVTVVDVDADSALESRYGERVPVLILGEPGQGVELCHYHLDAAAVTEALSAPPASGG
jgi:thiol-disulfide isomerase/thioredoxin